ncbi:hypothetical protein K437DRAFT_268018 [Tilletiaria anomala UBC 951]|uniref:Uncharacterized protein n=1 Tax=Tilletiaria anomala (strain ATCC 24038 / CBS 436.72 / UBC 951) TaxID=1037660 RepID=A0A066W7Q6_TILAU|nr:uncharacterized protein K437DRAFT_268018 [Tilletiaria anomala UBC 951]KDN46795.1 hypothetical protein K437DRAFT_268018 [Tilletiaria anomala UBC 951]
MSLNSADSTKAQYGTPTTTGDSNNVYASSMRASLQKANLDAHSPYCAYALSSLFALCAPFSFASAASSQIARTHGSYPTASTSSATATRQAVSEISQAVSSAAASSSSSPPSTAARVVTSQGARACFHALPPFWQLAGFSAVFAGGGYMISAGDSVNGSGTVTAWSLMYLFFHGFSGLRGGGGGVGGRVQPLALLLSAGTLTLGTLVHGSYYFDRTSWRGAVPGMVDTSKR